MAKPTHVVSRENKKRYYQFFRKVLAAYSHCYGLQLQIKRKLQQGVPTFDSTVEELRDREGLSRLGRDKCVLAFEQFAREECHLDNGELNFLTDRLEDPEFRAHIERHIAYILKNRRLELPLHSPDHIWKIYREKNPIPDPDQMFLF